MREGILSADLLFGRAAERASARREETSVRQPGLWDPEHYAREQIRFLVRQVFTNAERPVRQVVFSAVEAETDVRSICRQVGEALALETGGSIAMVLREAEMCRTETGPMELSEPLRCVASRLRGDLWQLPTAGKDSDTTALLHSYLGQVRQEFDYSIVEGAPAGDSNETMAMAQYADGIVLVLSAQRTRRATARKIKERLEGARARILGTVLSDRVFPIPQGIYRRL